MNCATFKRKLNDYIEENLGHDIEKAMEQHLTNCGLCNEMYEKELEIDNMFKVALSTENITFNSSRTDIMKNIDKNRYKNGAVNKTKFHFRKYNLSYGITAAVILCVVLVSPYLNLGSKKSVSKPNMENAKMDMAQKKSNTTDEVGSKNIDVTQNSALTPQFEKINIEKYEETKFHTPWKTSENGKLQACVDGKGENGLEEGIGKILIKDTMTKAVWSFDLIDNQVQNSPKFIEWYDNNNIIVIIGLGQGTVTPGGDVYLFDINSLKTTTLYKSNVKGRYQVLSLEKLKDRINFKVLIYEDDNYNKSHNENWYITPINFNSKEPFAIRNEKGQIQWSSDKQ